MRTKEVRIKERKKNLVRTGEKENDFPFLVFDTEDNSAELSKFIRLTPNGVNDLATIKRVAKKVKLELSEEEAQTILKRGRASLLDDKKVTQIAAITAAGETFYNKGDVEQFLTWLRRRKEVFIYANNVQYDIGNCYGDVLDELDSTLIGTRMIKAVEDSGKIYVDVWNYWQMSVEKLGEVFGLAKLKTDNMAEDKAYVFRDCEIIREAMLYVWKFGERIGLDNVPPTIGSFGVALWKLWGGSTIHHTAEITRDGIFGGRVELFKRRNASKWVFYCDINSLYPTMMTKAFPGELEDTGKELKKFGVAQVTIDIPECSIAVLPWRNPDGKIFYPFGTITGVWTIEEIRAAEKRGAKILEVHNVLSTDEFHFPYRDYVQRLYKLRKESVTKVEKSFYKLLMNARYGRAGTTGVITRTCIKKDRPNIFPECKRCKQHHQPGICFGKRVKAKYAMPLGEEVSWIDAAYITAYGRLELLKYMEKIGAENMIYCDTDSVIFDSPDGTIPFETGGELGQMKIETKCSACKLSWHPDKPCDAIFSLEQFQTIRAAGIEEENWDNIETFAPKMYVIAKQYRAKGVPRKKQREYIETGRAEFELPYKFSEAATFFDRGNTKELSVWRTVEKENRANYDKKELRGERYFPLRVDDV
jgi:hypothetical protein